MFIVFIEVYVYSNIFNKFIFIWLLLITKQYTGFFLSCRFTLNFNSLLCLLQYVFLQNRTSFLAYFSCSCSSCTRPLSRIPHTPGYDLRDTASNNHYLTSSQILSTNSHRNTHLRSGREKTCLYKKSVIFNKQNSMQNHK